MRRFKANARVAELADAPDLGSGGETRGGSSPPFRTKNRSRGPVRVANTFTHRQRYGILMATQYGALEPPATPDIWKVLNDQRSPEISALLRHWRPLLSSPASCHH